MDVVLDVLAAIAVVTLLAVAGVGAGVWRAAARVRDRVVTGVSPAVERWLGRTGARGLEHGGGIVAGRVQTPAALWTLGAAGVAALLVLLRWDAAVVRVAVVVGLLAAVVPVVAIPRLAARILRPRRRRPAQPPS